MTLANKLPETSIEKSEKTSIEKHSIEKTKVEKMANPSLASEFCKRIIVMINEFDKQLNHEQEVAIQLVSFDQNITLYVQGLSYWDPHLIVFLGTNEDGKPIQLIQHVSQLSFLLMAVPRLNPEMPKHKIGFSPVEN